MMAMAGQQRGLTFSGFLVTAILVIFIAIGLMKVIPAYTQDRLIHNILYTIAHDPDMQGASERDIRDSFYKRATVMNNVTSVNKDDINVAKGPGGLVLSVSYQVKVPLIGNASLVFDFDTTSAR